MALNKEDRELLINSIFEVILEDTNEFTNYMDTLFDLLSNDFTNNLKIEQNNTNFDDISALFKTDDVQGNFPAVIRSRD